MGWQGPNNLGSALTNARIRDKYFGSQEDGKFSLTLKGENFGRHDSKTKKAKKS